MRKMISMLILLLMTLMMLFASDDSASVTPSEEESSSSSTLKLRGYKVGLKEDPYVVITDAMNESLEVLSTSKNEDGTIKGSDIDVTKHIDQFLGDISNGGFLKDRVIFSYRVVGNTLGSFTLSLTMHDFKLTDQKTEEGNEKTSGTLRTRYDLSNFSYTFTGASSNTYEEAKIEANEGNVTEVIPSEEVDEGNNTEGNNPGLISKWSVLDTNPVVADGVKRTRAAWIHRGAVAMTISSTDYDNPSIPRGEYRATVGVTLSVVE